MPCLHATLRPLRPFRAEYDSRSVARDIRRMWRTILRSEHWRKARGLLRSPEARTLTERSSGCLDTTDALSCSFPEDISTSILEELLPRLIPWRVGPFTLGTQEIDTEWRSDRKWSRIEPLLPPLQGLRIADIGCSSGYFLFQLARRDPSLVVGFDPVDRCWLQVALLQSLLRAPRLSFLPLGLDSLTSFPRFFDIILCMGVIYHQRDPFRAVRTLYDSLRSGGTVILESLVVDAPGPYFLVPPDRYAKMRNAWLIPTADALAALLSRAGFRDIAIHRFGPLSTEEQRRTPLAPYESLAEFLDPNDSAKTIEGFPAPHTAAVVGKK